MYVYKNDCYEKKTILPKSGYDFIYLPFWFNLLDFLIYKFKFLTHSKLFKSQLILFI